jgi:glycosyltransferase involved in cell wall biosynthesis
MLLRNPDLWMRMHLAARRSVLQFSWKNVASQVHEMYDELVNETKLVAAL